MNENVKKVLAGVSIVAVAGVGVLAGFALDQPTTLVIDNTQEQSLTAFKEGVASVEPIIKEKIVKVAGEPVVQVVEDESFLALACDKLMFDDIMECKEEVLAEDNALKLALDLINDEDELFDFLEDESVIDDEDEARLIKVYDDFEDVDVLDSDFDDEEYEFKIKVRVEDEDADEKFKAFVTVKVEEGVAELVDVVLDE